MESADVASILDRFEGKGRHRLTFRLHFAPGSCVSELGQRGFTIRIDGQTLRIALEGFNSPRCRVWEGSENPTAGWMSPSYNHKVPAPTVQIEEEATFPATRSIRLELRPSAVTELSAEAAPKRGTIGRD